MSGGYRMDMFHSMVNNNMYNNSLLNQTGCVGGGYYGPSTGELITTGIFSLASIGGTIAIASAQQKAATQGASAANLAQLSTTTNVAINDFNASANSLTSAKEDYDAATEKLENKENIATLKGDRTKLEGEFQDAKTTEGKSLTEINTQVKALDTQISKLEGFLSTITSAEQTIAQNKPMAESKITVTGFSNVAGTFTFNEEGGPGQAATHISNLQGEYTKESGPGQLRFNQDLQLAQSYDQQFQKKLDAKKAIKEAESQKNTALSNASSEAGTSVKDTAGLQQIIQQKTQERDDLNSQTVTSNSGSKTVGEYNKEHKALDDKITTAEKSDKATLEKEQKALKSTYESSLSTFKTKARALKQQYDGLNKSLAALDNVAQQQADISTAKDAYKSAKQYNKNGGKRNAWQKLWGTGKTDSAKEAKAQIKIEKQQAKDATAGFEMSNGFKADQASRNHIQSNIDNILEVARENKKLLALAGISIP